jgi:hypothetical protein
MTSYANIRDEIDKNDYQNQKLFASIKLIIILNFKVQIIKWQFMESSQIAPFILPLLLLSVSDVIPASSAINHSGTITYARIYD